MLRAFEIRQWRNFPRRDQVGPLIAALMGLCAVVGCGPEPISVYQRVPQTRPMGRDLDSGESRMVVTIFQQEDAWWFFKMVGPKPLLDGTEQIWQPFLDTVTFDSAGEPKWQLPAGWQLGRSGQFRYATIIINREPRLEFIVSSLPANQDLLANVNRWRNELSLPPIDSNAEQYVRPRAEGEGGVLVFDETGTQSRSAGMSAPFAGGSVEQSESVVNLDFDISDAWEVIATSTPAVRRFARELDGGKLQLSITRMRAGAMTWSETARMWAGQVGADINAQQIDQRTQQSEIAGAVVKQIRFDAAAADAANAPAPDAPSLIAVLVEKGDSAWYFKLSGPMSLVSKAQAEFNQLIQSIRFE